MPSIVRRLAFVLALSLAPLGASGQLQSVAISRSVAYTQDGTGEPTFAGTSVDSFLLFDGGKAGVRAQLEKPNGTVTLAADEYLNYTRSDSYATSQAMTNAYPNGQYRFRLSGTASGTYALNLSSFVPPPFPRFLNAEEAGAISSIAPFTFRWSVPEVLPTDVVTIAITADDGTVVMQPYAMDSAVSVFSIYLSENKGLYVHLTVSRVVRTITYSNNISGIVLSSASTTLVARTKSLLDSVFLEQPVRTLTVPTYSRTRLKARVSDPSGFRLKWQWCQPGSTLWQDLGYFGNGASTTSEELFVDNVQPTWDGLRFRLSVDTDKGKLYSDESVIRLSPGYSVNTAAGVFGGSGWVDGVGSKARFEAHTGATADARGNVYVASSTTVRQVTTSNEVIHLAGYPGSTGMIDGRAFEVRFMEIADIVAAPDSTIYIVDRGARTIRRLRDEVYVTTIAGQPGVSGNTDGPAASASFYSPTKIARDNQGRLFIADSTPADEPVLRMLTPGGVVSTLSIPGPVLGPILGLAVDSQGQIYLSDGSPGVRRIHPDGTYTTLADSIRDYRWFTGAREIVVDPFDTLYVSDGDQAVLRLSPDGDIVVIFGTRNNTFYYNGSGGGAEGCHAHLVALPNGSIGIADPKYFTFRLAAPVAALAVTITPSSSAVPVDGSLTLAASTPLTGSPVQYQWMHDGVAVPNANMSTLTISHVQPQDAGDYTVSITQNGLYSGSTPARVSVNTPPLAQDAGVLNLSTRAVALSGDHSLIPGFVIVGTGTKRVLVRAIGPSLAAFGVADPLSDPEFTLLKRHGTSWTTLAGNDDWDVGQDSAAVATITQQVGAFALPTGSLDSALVVDLEPGHYTVVNSVAKGVGGVALVEVYDADDRASTAYLNNLSTRGYVGAGDSLMVPGFVVNAPRRFLIRAVGPELASHGLTDVLRDPRLALHRKRADGSGSEVIRSNDNWYSQPGVAELQQATAAVGAFPLHVDGADAALLMVLNPGIYSVHATGADGTTGIALVELYLVP